MDRTMYYVNMMRSIDLFESPFLSYVDNLLSMAWAGSILPRNVGRSTSCQRSNFGDEKTAQIVTSCANTVQRKAVY